MNKKDKFEIAKIVRLLLGDVVRTKIIEKEFNNLRFNIQVELKKFYKNRKKYVRVNDVIDEVNKIFNKIMIYKIKVPEKKEGKVGK